MSARASQGRTTTAHLGRGHAAPGRVLVVVQVGHQVEVAVRSPDQAFGLVGLIDERRAHVASRAALVADHTRDVAVLQVLPCCVADLLLPSARHATASGDGLARCGSRSRLMRRRAQGADLLGKRGHHVGEFLALRGRDPVDKEPLRFHARELEQAVHQRIATAGIVVALLVVAVAGVAAQHHHPVRAILKGLEHKERVDAPRTGHANDAHVLRVAGPAGPGQVGPGIAAPVAQKADDLGFKGVF